MRGSRKLSRRSFLLFAGAAGGTALWAPNLATILDPLGRGVAEDSERAARRLGGFYLARHPEEADTAALERALFGTAGNGWDGGRAAQTWAAACRADFRAERLVVLDGWWLARSEARLCALLHLDAGRKT
jgi:hypothetical protein